jgi:hypothetical protein
MLSIEIQASKFRSFLEQFPKNQSHFVIFGLFGVPQEISTTFNNIQQLSIEDTRFSQSRPRPERCPAGDPIGHHARSSPGRR